MKFTTTSDLLTKHLVTLGSLLNSNSLPILESFLFELDKRALKISASDLEATMSVTIEVDSKDTGKVAIPGKILVETLKTFHDQPLTFTCGKQVEIMSESGKFKLATYDAGEFPVFPKVQGEAVEIPASKFTDVINKTIFATSTDELRPVLMGLYVTNGEFVTTDAQRLVRYKSDLGFKDSFIVPKRPLQVLVRAMNGNEGSVKVTHSDNNAKFVFGDYELTCRLIDGKYPNYEAVIPKSNPNMLTINRNLFLNTLKRVSIFSNKTTHQVNLQLSDGKLEVIGEDSDNQGSEVVNCGYVGSPMKIAFNAKYLTEALSNLDTETVTMELSEPNKAGLIRPTGKEITSLTMPIQAS